jgi:hypothetical protein
MGSQSTDTILNLKESYKDSYLNDILEKIKIGIGLSDSEKNFINQYDHLIENDLRDLSHLSKNQVFEKICYFLDKNKNIICDLYDKNGKINDKILGISNLFEDDCCLLTLKHGDVVKIFDRYLYKISYNIKKDQYNLELQGEYYEKINKDNED